MEGGKKEESEGRKEGRKGEREVRKVGGPLVASEASNALRFFSIIYEYFGTVPTFGNTDYRVLICMHFGTLFSL